MDPRVIFFYVTLLILVGISAIQFFRRGLMPKIASRVFLYSTGITFAYLIWISFLQFKAFYGGILNGVLGTVDGLTWFLGYVRLHYANEYLISFPIAILFALIANFFNKKYNERFFEKEELYLIATGILLTGYPGFIFYIPLVLLCSIIASLIFVRRGERFPLYHFWIPTALVALLVIHFWASSQLWWASFRF